MNFEYDIGGRYLKAGRKQGFITLLTFLSVAGITVGVMALIVVMAVMTGFEADLVVRILGGQSHVVLKHNSGALSGYQQLANEAQKIEGVEAASPFIDVQGMLRSRFGILPAMIKGIDPATAGRVIKTLEHVALPYTSNPTELKDKAIEIPPIVLAKELARNLGVVEDDIISLISPGKTHSSIVQIPVMKQFRVSGFFQSGMYDFDRSFAYIHLKDAQKMLGMGESVTGIEVRVKDIYEAGRIGANIGTIAGPDFLAQDWMQLNNKLFEAMKTERLAMFIILTFTILVAAFSIASTLIMMVIAKTKDIAILKAMGATNKSIKKIFIINGMVIGLIGTSLGLGLGLLLCTVLKYYDISELTKNLYYFMPTVPVKVEVFHVISIISAALIICFLGALYPARQAAKLDPINAIRDAR